MATLYEINGALAGLIAQLDMAESSEQYDAIVAAIDGLALPYTEKLDAYAKRMQNKKREAEMYGAEAKRLLDLQEKCELEADRMNQRVFDSMKLLNIPEVPTSIGTWKMKKNPLRCDVEDIKAVPEAYRKPIAPPKIPYTVDKDKAKADFKATGEIIPGLNIYSKEVVVLK